MPRGAESACWQRNGKLGYDKIIDMEAGAATLSGKTAGDCPRKRSPRTIRRQAIWRFESLSARKHSLALTPAYAGHYYITHLRNAPRGRPRIAAVLDFFQIPNNRKRTSETMHYDALVSFPWSAAMSIAVCQWPREPGAWLSSSREGLER